MESAKPPDYSVFLYLVNCAHFRVIGLLLLAETIQTLLNVFVKLIFIKYLTSAFLSAGLCLPTSDNQS